MFTTYENNQKTISSSILLGFCFRELLCGYFLTKDPENTGTIENQKRAILVLQAVTLIINIENISKSNKKFYFCLSLNVFLKTFVKKPLRTWSYV